MKRIFLFLILFLCSSAFSQTSKFMRYFAVNGVAITNAAVELVPQGSSYPAAAIYCISKRNGWYYRDGITDGEYKIYLNGSLYKEHVEVGDYRLQWMLEKWNGEIKIDTSAIKDSSITETKIKVATLSKISKLLGDVILNHISTDSTGTRITIDSLGNLKFYDDNGLVAVLKGYNNPTLGHSLDITSALTRLTGALRVDGNVKFTSSLDTGKVVNLNADFLDGKSSEAFPAKSHFDTLVTAVQGKEPAFGKNTAFNKNFGSTAGTVCQGNDSRLSDARAPLTHGHYGSEIYIGSAGMILIDGGGGIAASTKGLTDLALKSAASSVTIITGIRWLDDTVVKLQFRNRSLTIDTDGKIIFGSESGWTDVPTVAE